MANEDGRLARGEATRRTMLAAATTIVARQGMSELTHRAVASAAGVSPALVAYHFANTHALRRATLAYVGDRVAAQLGLLLGPTPDPAEVPSIAADLAVWLATDLHDEAAAMHEFLAAATRDPGLRPSVDALLEKAADLIEPLSGSRELAVTAGTFFLGFTMITMARGGADDPEELRTQVVRLISAFDPSVGA